MVGLLKVPNVNNEILKNLRSNYSKVEDLIVDSIEQSLLGADVTFHFYGLKKDEKRIRTIINRWADRGYIGNITIPDKDVKMHALSLLSVTCNRPGPVRIHDEFIISCVARGPPSMTFRWFKDGIFVNVTASVHKWTRLIKDPHEPDKYTALLGIERADVLDDGLFSCQVEDLNIQQCMSKRVHVIRPPSLIVDPMSITVRKGENFSISCFPHDEDGHYNFDWTKNGALLKRRSANEKYEILYPSGTILQVFNAEKDARYSCVVPNEIKSETEVMVHVVDRENVHTCPEEIYLNLTWPETAPDTNSLQKCHRDRGYYGSASRSCSLRDGLKPTWSLPDFSGCTHIRLQELHLQLEQLKVGYVSDQPVNILKNLLEYLSQNKSTGILPGEGARILSIVQEVIRFLNSSKLSSPFPEVTTYVFSILNQILSRENSLVNQTQVNLVQQILKEHLPVVAPNLLTDSVDFHRSFPTVDLSVIKILETKSNKNFQIPLADTSYREWFGVTVIEGGRKKSGNESDFIVVVMFRNISAFLPPRSFVRLKDGSEMTYKIFSQIVNIWFVPETFKHSALVMDLRHTGNWSGDDGWAIRCASTNSSTFNFWKINECQTVAVNDSTTRCICPFAGTFALLLTTTSPEEENKEEDPQRYILIAGCSLCMVLALFTTVCLVTSCWTYRRSWLIFLKLQCSVSLLGASAIFTCVSVFIPDQNSFMYLNPLLEIFLLMGMSSHLSKLLIVFTELVQLPKRVTSKQTVVGIISGVPIITVFGSHLAYRTMNIQLQSWWMITGTLAFNIYVTASSIMFGHFIFLHITVIKKLQELLELHEKQAKPILKRMALLRRSGCIFIAITGLSISSIVYVNSSENIWALYQFTVANVLMGLLLLVCYVAKSETDFRQLFKSPTVNKDDKFFSVDSTSSPLNFLMKQEAEMENESGVQMKPDIRRSSSKISECHRMMDTLSKSQSISATFESCLHNSTSFCDGHDDQASTPRREQSDVLENYNCSPQHFRKYSTFSSNQSSRPKSPDILASKVCVELDLVASSIQTVIPDKSPSIIRRIPYPKVIVTPDDAIAKILESETNLNSERTQPDGHEKALATSGEGVGAVPPNPSSSGSDELDGMLDSISQDLDYLLNRSEEVEGPVQSSTLRRISKPPAPSVIHEIREESEEDDANVPEAITNILRTNC